MPAGRNNRIVTGHGTTIKRGNTFQKQDQDQDQDHDHDSGSGSGSDSDSDSTHALSYPAADPYSIPEPYPDSVSDARPECITCGICPCECFCLPTCDRPTHWHYIVGAIKHGPYWVLIGGILHDGTIDTDSWVFHSPPTKTCLRIKPVPRASPWSIPTNMRPEQFAALMRQTIRYQTLV